MDDTFKWRWAHVDESDKASRYIDILNRAHPDDDPAGLPTTMAWIDALPGERILEIGCGNGAVARAVARHVLGIREIVATDSSAAMIEAARQQSAHRELPVTYTVADALHLPFPDASFDRAYATELFVILPHPHEALREMGRVTRPGGRICIRENDLESHAILASDPSLERRIMRFVADHEYNGSVALQIIGWCKELGWEVEVTPAVGWSTDGTRLLETLLPEWLADAETAGVVTTEEADIFIADLSQRQNRGQFISYTVNFRITARKPGGTAISEASLHE